MSFVARDYPGEGDDQHSRFTLYEDDNADQHEEHQSTDSELPAEIQDSQPEAEIPDSQPDPYLPAEIPDSQPKTVYHQDLPFDDLDYSEVLSQLPTRDHGELYLRDAQAFDLSDYDLREEAAADSGDDHLADQENIDPRASRFDGFRREGVDESVYDESGSSSSSSETEIIPGGTRLTERLKNRVVSLYHHPSIRTTPLAIYLKSSQPHQILFHVSYHSYHLHISQSVSSTDFNWP